MLLRTSARVLEFLCARYLHHTIVVQVELQLGIELQHVIFLEKFPYKNQVDKTKPYIVVSVENLRRGGDMFLDYLIGGLKFHCIVGINFAGKHLYDHSAVFCLHLTLTTSRKDLAAPDSGHNVHDASDERLILNGYQRVINSVIPILEDYNKDQSVSGSWLRWSIVNRTSCNRKCVSYIA